MRARRNSREEFFLVSFMRVSSMFSFLLLLFVLCPLVLFGCSAYRVSLYCCCPVQVGGGGGAQKDSRCTTTVVYYSSYSLVIETIQHVMSGPSSHSYNSPFCYVSLLCERASSSAVSSHPAPPLARVTKRMRNNTHTAPFGSSPHFIQAHAVTPIRYQTCFFVSFPDGIGERDRQIHKTYRKGETRLFFFSLFLIIFVSLLLLDYIGCCITMVMGGKKAFGTAGNVGL